MLTEELERSDSKNRNIGLATSVGIHGLLLLLFFFLLAYTPPNPPLPSYGVELNFGLDDQGSGDIQNTGPTGNEPQPNEQVQTGPQEQSTPQENTASSPAESGNDNQLSDPNAETVVNAEEPKSEPKKSIPENKTPAVNESEKQPTKPSELNSKALFNKSNSGNNNNGDDNGKVGDKGNPEGSLNAKAFYGNPGTGNGGPGGSGGGSSLELSGWTWDFKPKPKDESNENGRIVFEIKVNQDGEIESIKTLEKTVTPAVEKVYRAEVERLTFSKINNSTEAPPLSTGKITFIIRSR
ncbi:MAG: hypothetical protein K2Q22_02705 [Cytophagales bacterium]|nr:hypothetical protein [Cytophagales bacterium]